MVLCSSARCAGPCLPARRTGTATPRSRWRSGRSIAGRTPPSIPRCAITQPKLTGFSSSSGSLAKGSPSRRDSSKPTSWSWKCTGRRPASASSGSSAGAIAPSCPPTSTITATTSASSRTISAAPSAWARATRCATCRIRWRRAGRRSTTLRSATRRRSSCRSAPSASSRCACGPSVSTKGRSSAPCSSISRPPTWSAWRSTSRRRRTSIRSSKTSVSCSTTRCGKGAFGCRIARKSRSGAGPRGSTFPRAASSPGARWEINGYEFTVGLATSFFTGEEIAVAPKAVRDSFPWRVPLAAAIQDVAEPVRENDLQRVRAEVGRIVGRRTLSGLKRERLGARSLSELLHVNRVEGLAAGAGFVLRTRDDGYELRALGSYGFADGSGKGNVAVTSADGLELSAYRQVRDIGDVPVIAPLFNSIAAQEFGDDYGDYYRASGVQAAVRKGIGARGEWRLAAARERVASLRVHADPATGRYRPNPAVADGDFSTATLTLRRRSERFAVRRDAAGEFSVEFGDRYARLSADGHILVPLSARSRLLARVQLGWGSARVPG